MKLVKMNSTTNLDFAESEKALIATIKSENKAGLRFNSGKIRYDLLPPVPIDEFAKVLTKGSQKYAERNWEKGMKWTTVLASLKRHIAKMEMGEDYDSETGLLHMAHAMCNAAFLIEYYHTHPEYDDRQHGYTKKIRIGLDLDDVIVDFMGGFKRKFGYELPGSWNFTYSMPTHFEDMFKSGEIYDFFMNLEPAVNPSDLPFEPAGYVTARSIPTEWSMQWLENNGFPTVPVYSVPFNASKVKTIQEAGIDWFIDDKFENFVELNNAGICTFLWDKRHNQRYDVGYKRVLNFNDFKTRFL